MTFSDENTKFIEAKGLDYTIDKLRSEIKEIVTGNIDFSDYVKVSELQDQINKLEINVDLSKYATIDSIAQAIQQEIDKLGISQYVTDEELESILQRYALSTDIPEITNLDNYATKSELTLALTEIENKIPSMDGVAHTSDIPDVSGFATTKDVESTYAKKEEIPSLEEYAKKSEIPSLKDYAKKSELPSLEGYATESFVTDSIGNIDFSPYTTQESLNQTLESYASKSDIEKIYATKDEIPSLDGYATESYVDESINAIDYSDYTTQESLNETLKSYALKSELPPLVGYATESYVESAVEDVVETAKEEIAETYATKEELPDLSSYATTESVTAAIAEIELTPGPKGDKGEDGLPGAKGEKGDAGEDGFSPIINVVTDDEGIKLEITTKSGKETTANLKGEKGERGEKGEQGLQGEKGLKGDKGDKGDTGELPKVREITTSLTVGGWKTQTGYYPYIYTLTVTNLSATQLIFIHAAMNLTQEQLEGFADAGIIPKSQDVNTIVLQSRTRPKVDLPIVIDILGEVEKSTL